LCQSHTLNRALAALTGIGWHNEGSSPAFCLVTIKAVILGIGKFGHARPAIHLTSGFCTKHFLENQKFAAEPGMATGRPP
jgi:hypothetical protein